MITCMYDRVMRLEEWRQFLISDEYNACGRIAMYICIYVYNAEEYNMYKFRRDAELCF